MQKRKTKEIAIVSAMTLIAFLSAKAGHPQAVENTPKVETEINVEVVEKIEIKPVKKNKVTTPTKEEAVEETMFFDVPLSEELQLHIFEECEKHNIAPSIIIAMIERESDYDASTIGDNGNSLGLMQIQPKWHQERMSKLGCKDLMNPFENVTVGIDYVAELKEKNNDLYWVLMAYNGGPSYANKRIESGNYSDYALEVTEMAAEFERKWN